MVLMAIVYLATHHVCRLLVYDNNIIFIVFPTRTTHIGTYYDLRPTDSTGRGLERVFYIILLWRIIVYYLKKILKK